MTSTLPLIMIHCVELALSTPSTASTYLWSSCAEMFMDTLVTSGPSMPSEGEMPQYRKTLSALPLVGSWVNE